MPNEPEAFPSPTGSAALTFPHLKLKVLWSLFRGLVRRPVWAASSSFTTNGSLERQGQTFWDACCILWCLGEQRFPKDTMQLLTAARLVAVCKMGGGVRPIAAGKVLRRLAAKCVLQSVLASVAIWCPCKSALLSLTQRSWLPDELSSGAILQGRPRWYCRLTSGTPSVTLPSFWRWCRHASHNSVRTPLPAFLSPLPYSATDSNWSSSGVWWNWIWPFSTGIWTTGCYQRG